MTEITAKQRELIEDMNEFCREKFNFDGKSKKDASEYISRNITEFKLLLMDTWQLKYL